MIPDKIYLVKDAANPEGVFDTVASKKPMFQDDICYIRKDALLERLEKVAAEYKKRSDEGELVWQNMCGINKAIDILNKM